MKPRLLDQLRDAIRVRNYSIRTEQAYSSWAKRFIRFHQMKRPAEMGDLEVVAFLTHLAVNRNVAANTQNQALNALVFLYKHVIGEPLGDISKSVRAKKPSKLPVVLTRDEVRQVLFILQGNQRLIVTLLYGSGLRLMESLQLRIKVGIKRRSTRKYARPLRSNFSMPGGVRKRLSSISGRSSSM